MIRTFKHFLSRRCPRLSIRLSAAILILGTVAVSGTLAQDATITPNYKDADIRQVIEAVGEITGKNFVLDPRVKAQTIAEQFLKRFPDTMGIMQATGDPWMDNAASRICGSPFGRPRVI